MMMIKQGIGYFVTFFICSLLFFNMMGNNFNATKKKADAILASFEKEMEETLSSMGNDAIVNKWKLKEEKEDVVKRVKTVIDNVLNDTTKKDITDKQRKNFIDDLKEVVIAKKRETFKEQLIERIAGGRGKTGVVVESQNAIIKYLTNEHIPHSIKNVIMNTDSIKRKKELLMAERGLTLEDKVAQMLNGDKDADGKKVDIESVRDFADERMRTWLNELVDNLKDQIINPEMILNALRGDLTKEELAVFDKNREHFKKLIDPKIKNIERDILGTLLSKYNIVDNPNPLRGNDSEGPGEFGKIFNEMRHLIRGEIGEMKNDCRNQVYLTEKTGGISDIVKNLTAGEVRIPESAGLSVNNFDVGVSTVRHQIGFYNSGIKNEDAVVVKNLDGDPLSSVMGVFDGHGGPEVSSYVGKNFPDFLNKFLKEEMTKKKLTVDGLTPEEITHLMQKAFVEFDVSIWAKYKEGKLKIPQDGFGSGTTVSVAVEIGENMVFANLGDSPFRVEKKNGGVILSRDHDVKSTPSEQQRILNAGEQNIIQLPKGEHVTSISGRVKVIRQIGTLVVEKNIEVTRAFGDFSAKITPAGNYPKGLAGQLAVSPIPDVVVVRKSEIKIGAVYSDGVTKKVKEEDEYKRIISEAGDLPEDIARALTHKAAIERQSPDDTTALIFRPKISEKEKKLIKLNKINMGEMIQNRDK